MIIVAGQALMWNGRETVLPYSTNYYLASHIWYFLPEDLSTRFSPVQPQPLVAMQCRDHVVKTRVKQPDTERDARGGDWNKADTIQTPSDAVRLHCRRQPVTNCIRSYSRQTASRPINNMEGRQTVHTRWASLQREGEFTIITRNTYIGSSPYQLLIFLYFISSITLDLALSWVFWRCFC